MYYEDPLVGRDVGTRWNHVDKCYFIPCRLFTDIVDIENLV